MIRQLRMKFIFIAMLSMSLVLGVIMFLVNHLNYVNVEKNADNMLNIIASHRDEFPIDGQTERDLKWEHSGRPDRMTSDRFFLEELDYELRFFVVVLDKDNDPILVDTRFTSIVDTDEAVQYVKTAMDLNEDNAFIDHYRYLITPNGDGTTHYFFLDCDRDLKDFRNFRDMSIAISILGLVVVFDFIISLSGFAFKPVEEGYEKQKRFITDAGHEIKTPLAIINVDADVLEMNLGEDNEWVTDIRIQVQRLKELTDDLITLSKIEEGKMHPNFSINNLSMVVEDAVDYFETSADKKNRIIVKEIEPDITYECDAKAIMHAVSVLMSNSIKYSVDGSSIHMSLRKEDKHIKLTVANTTAETLSKKDLAHIFDRFYRADESRNSETGGYGIGLSIAKAVVETHGGKISCDVSEDNLFSIRIVL